MSNFNIDYSDLAKEQLLQLRKDPSKKAIAKAVIKVLGFMMVNIKHPSLNTHKYSEMQGPRGEEVFDKTLMNNGEFFPYAQDGHYNPENGNFDARK